MNRRPVGAGAASKAARLRLRAGPAAGGGAEQLARSAIAASPPPPCSCLPPSPPCLWPPSKAHDRARSAALPTRRRRSSAHARSCAPRMAAPELRTRLATRVATAPAPAAARQSRHLNPQFPGRRRLASPPSEARGSCHLRAPACHRSRRLRPRLAACIPTAVAPAACRRRCCP
ncbi:hypothetical protein PVAP13_8KG349804 [Panicum virgatum]|uniref:Uncharacterized protein n=1 Tax=Panicum virgatum TaxID=38727 RepID=A0A8T0PWT0_PANVG|nr:hypothetical protein PVAP13_8KG349804 [Panicum virgatum]